MNTTNLPICLLAIGVLTACGGGGHQAEAPKPAAAPAPAATPAAPPSNYAGGPVTDGGTLSGVVTYAGTEADGTVAVTKDAESCQAPSATMPAETLVVLDGKLANVVVMIDGITKGKAFEPGTVEVDNRGCHFVPHVVVGHLGGKFVTKNSDPILHNTNLKLMDGGRMLYNIPLPTQGQTAEKAIKGKAGLVEITCDAHEWMKAYLWQSEHPYAVVTGADGSFSMSDVPAGTYTVKYWHERLGEKTASVTVAAGGAVTADVVF